MNVTTGPVNPQRGRAVQRVGAFVASLALLAAGMVGLSGAAQATAGNGSNWYSSSSVTGTRGVQSTTLTIEAGYPKVSGVFTSQGAVAICVTGAAGHAALGQCWSQQFTADGTNPTNITFTNIPGGTFDTIGVIGSNCTITSNAAGADHSYGAGSGCDYGFKIGTTIVDAGIQTISLSVDKTTMRIGETAQATISGLSSNPGTTSFISTNVTCSVDSTGLITALIYGTCAIKAAAAWNGWWEYTVTAETRITSTYIPEVVSLATSPSTGTVGTPVQLILTGQRGTGPVYYYDTGSGTATCTVDRTSGVLTASTGGTCVVMATAGSDGTRYSLGGSGLFTVTFAAATTPPATAGGGGGGGGTSTPAATTTTTPAVVPEVTGVAGEPMLTSAGETVVSEPGTADYLDSDGGTTPADYAVEDDAVVAGNEDDLQIQLRPANDVPVVTDGDGVDAAGIITFIRGKKGVARGTGFKPGSDAEVWLFSQPKGLATVPIGADGTFEVEFDVPDDVPAGNHTIQAEGVTPGNSTRAITAGVQVSDEPQAPKTKRKVNRTTVAFTFPRLSSTPAGNVAKLTRLVKKSGASAVLIRGYVQPNSDTSNDASLSLARARHLASAIKALDLGLPVKVVASKRSTAPGAVCKKARNRCATATVTYVKTSKQ